MQKPDIRPLTRIRSAQCGFGSKLTGEPEANTNPEGTGDFNEIFRGN